MPPAAVLYGLLVIVSFTMSHSAVEVEGQTLLLFCKVFAYQNNAITHTYTLIGPVRLTTSDNSHGY